MRICRFETGAEGGCRLGVVKGDAVHDVTAVTESLPTLRWPIPSGDLLIAHLDDLRPEIAELAEKAPPLPLDAVRLKSPVANPGKFLCGAGNYPEVLARGGHPRRLGLLFKMTSAAAGESDGVTLRWPERTTFYETELAIVIGKAGTEISADRALDHVAGYSIGLDMTMQGDEFPSFGKSFDTYGVIGPWMVTADEIPDPRLLDFELKVNGETRQKDSIGRLVLGVEALIEHASSIMTLHPGDVIFTGTPPTSVGPVRPGDVMIATISKIGTMRVEVRGGPGRRTPLDGMNPSVNSG